MPCKHDSRIQTRTESKFKVTMNTPCDIYTLWKLKCIWYVMHMTGVQHHKGTKGLKQRALSVITSSLAKESIVFLQTSLVPLRAMDRCAALSASHIYMIKLIVSDSMLSCIFHNTTSAYIQHASSLTATWPKAFTQTKCRHAKVVLMKQVLANWQQWCEACTVVANPCNPDAS